MKFDMIANEIATKEHRTLISQFSPSMISKTHNTMKQNAKAVIVPVRFFPLGYTIYNCVKHALENYL
jgi:hypothetical protein